MTLYPKFNELKVELKIQVPSEFIMLGQDGITVQRCQLENIYKDCKLDIKVVNFLFLANKQINDKERIEASLSNTQVLKLLQMFV